MATTPIPPKLQATQIPPPPGGTLPGWLYKTFGPSYRTTMAGAFTAFVSALNGLVTLYPSSIPAKLVIPAHIFLLVCTSAGVAKMGVAAKDKSATGVES